MKNYYLLDTHILIWWLSNDKKLSKTIKNVIAKPENHIFISTVSIWEIAIKKSLNKLKIPNDLKDIVYSNDFDVLSINVDHVLQLEYLPLLHKDPFDRLLIAQSIIENLTLITTDKIIPEYKINCL